MEGRALRVENTEYPWDFQLVRLDLLLVLGV